MTIDFDKGNGLIPAIVQDRQTQKVLMLGYMNAAALKKTRAEKKVTFFSRSKNRLWTKGETSGNYLQLNDPEQDIRVDCDGDTLLIQATPVGPVCHTGADTCFGETNGPSVNFLTYLSEVVHNRRVNPQEGSYTGHLFEKGLNKIAQKVGEEAVELVIEAKDENDDLFTNEAADLLFHLLVLLEKKSISLTDVMAVLHERHSPQKEPSESS